VRAALIEMHRVLKPGGLCSVSTEFRLDGPGPGLPGIHMIDPYDIETSSAAPPPGSSWAGPLELTPLAAHTARRHRRSSKPPGTSGGLPRYLVYPHIVLDHQHGPRTWTSIHLALRKPE
jgi:hypothetical protein